MDVTPSRARAFNIAHHVQPGAPSTRDPGGIPVFLLGSLLPFWTWVRVAGMRAAIARTRVFSHER